LLITWLIQPIKEEVVGFRVVVDVEIGVMVIEALGVVAIEEAVEAEEIAVEDAERRRRKPGSPSPSLVVL